MELTSTLRLKEIFLGYPVYKTDDLIIETTEQKYYNCFTTSTFDHWLTKEEAREQVVFYSQRMNQAQKEKYNRFEKKYMGAFAELYSKWSVFAMISDYTAGSHITERLYSFRTAQEFLEVCVNSLREKELFKLFIPEKHTLIEGSYDLCNLVFVKKESPSYSEIRAIFQKHGLFALE